jgi:pimeloyl-ACP methyl ester carboxylesterase
VAGFIGLDNSVPGQQAPDTYQGDIRSDGGLHPTYTILRFMGLARVERWINGDNSMFFPANPLLDSEDRASDWLLNNTKLDLWVLDNEESWYLPNDIELQGRRFPSAIPTLMILALDSIELVKQYGMPGWVEVHEAVASENPLSNIVTLPGGHMVYQNNPDRVVAQIDEFLTATA